MSRPGKWTRLRGSLLTFHRERRQQGRSLDRPTFELSNMRRCCQGGDRGGRFGVRRRDAEPGGDDRGVGPVGGAGSGGGRVGSSVRLRSPSSQRACRPCSGQGRSAPPLSRGRTWPPRRRETYGFCLRPASMGAAPFVLGHVPDTVLRSRSGPGSSARGPAVCSGPQRRGRFGDRRPARERRSGAPRLPAVRHQPWSAAAALAGPWPHLLGDCPAAGLERVGLTGATEGDRWLAWRDVLGALEGAVRFR